MKKIDYDILKAKILINQVFDYELTLDNYRYFEKIYPFTTENIKGYYDKLDFENKDVLTVGSSGDHTLNLYTKKVNSVDFFDINSFSKYYFDLKVGAIKSLSYEEFFKYFCYCGYPRSYNFNDETFNIELYRKISPYLNEKTKYFWDSLYLENSGYEIRRSDLFTSDEENCGILQKVNSYLDEKNYYELQDHIHEYKNPHFYNKAFNELDIKKKYDVIMLSNIAQYLKYIYKENPLKEFKNDILKLENNLKDDGVILLSYLYDMTHMYYLIDAPLIYDFEEVKKYFSDLEVIKFRGIENIKYHQQIPIKDGMLVYKKTKK